MTPSNTDKTPFIFRFLDSLGVPHTVVPSNHNHSQSEVDGLETALNAKANTTDVNTALAGKMDKMTVDEVPTSGSNNLVKSGGVKAALDAKYSINQVDENDEQEAHLLAIAEDDSIYFDFRLKNGNTEKQVLLTMSKMDNLERAISNPDTTPTANSDNLVTSGGVEAAIIPVISVSDMDNKQGADDHYVFVVSGVFEDGGDTERRLLSIYTKSLTTGIRVTQVLSGPNGYQTRSARLGSSFGNWTSYEYATKSWVDTQLAGKQNTLTFDSTPTANSTNPVTSGGVKNSLDGKQNTLTFDNTPTNNSNNPVKSNGIFNALGEKVNVSDVMPEFLEYDGQYAIDLDSIITDSKGIHRFCIQNISGMNVQFDDLFFSSDGRNIHVNINSGAQISQDYYVIATIYKIDDSAHEHDVCYFIELNGIFDDGN